MPVGTEEATHLVVDDVSVKELPSALALPSTIVRGEVSFNSSSSKFLQGQTVDHFRLIWCGA
jgi:hypothetical protein